MNEQRLRRTGKTERCDLSTRIVYRTLPGRLLLSLLVRPIVSKIAGAFLDSPLSRPMIKPFIKKHRIDMSPYHKIKYRSFNQFFMRKIRASARPVCEAPEALVSPCDSRLSAYRINDSSSFMIKGSPYTVRDLLGGNSELAKQYSGGHCLIFRLCVNDYHRYIYFDDCVKDECVYIPGKLHTVRPIALEYCNIYKRNCREYCVLHTEHFGQAVQIEVGAMLVGKIVNNHRKGFHLRGAEKGKFMFGGSTVVILLKPDAAIVDRDILLNTDSGLETIVKMGERIGTSAQLPELPE